MASEKRPIRSRNERASVSSPPPAPGVDVEGVSDEDGLRRLARDHGYRLVKDERVNRGPRVRTLFHLSSDVRIAMERAKLELGMSYSRMADHALVMFLESRGLHVEGWTPD